MKQSENDKLAEALGYRKVKNMFKATRVSPSSANKEKMRRRIILEHFLGNIQDNWELIKRLKEIKCVKS